MAETKKTSSSSKTAASRSAASAAKKTAAAKTSSSAKKTTGAKKTSTSKKTAAKKSSTARKTTASTTIKLTAAEKKLVQDYRKCSAVGKKMISAAAEKIAGTGKKEDLSIGGFDVGSLLNIFQKK